MTSTTDAAALADDQARRITVTIDAPTFVDCQAIASAVNDSPALFKAQHVSTRTENLGGKSRLTMRFRRVDEGGRGMSTNEALLEDRRISRIRNMTAAALRMEAQGLATRLSEVTEELADRDASPGEDFWREFGTVIEESGVVGWDAGDHADAERADAAAARDYEDERRGDIRRDEARCEDASND